MRDPIKTKISEPYPIIEESEIINGFGRGSSELGIPTANIPISSNLNKLDPGIYFGFSKLIPVSKDLETKKRSDGHLVEFNHGANLSGEETCVFPMVMSIGYNPFYNNTEKTAEVHIIHKFQDNFYGAKIKHAVLGYIRPELNYTTKEALIEDINLDIEMALRALESSEYNQYKHKIL
ncbi:riboflavin kinase [Yamadazyma tenuis]|uniref:Riboflavin kinase n=1 Tax=Candida tenuis (strain ATCC 10573 / BCRC 21748 / CBS 615 / JCM 9827 / NBRC 10315 / NRRL Y-1498 / VKM Y-70) TaxID=590646 RepID=G3B5V9_CANTC|nr:riboflavin kinase [Yamadazyma tenuis ATCC 10573]EGV63317.1 riboflavin kinase [Yamadazyma tenuis ATCC 10573]WEJ96864.1 riboflavin kinase [Yamadazyma tenuis]